MTAQEEQRCYKPYLTMGYAARLIAKGAKWAFPPLRNRTTGDLELPETGMEAGRRLFGEDAFHAAMRQLLSAREAGEWEPGEFATDGDYRINKPLPPPCEKVHFACGTALPIAARPEGAGEQATLI